MLIGLEPRLAHLSKAAGAAGIALERSEVRRSIPRTPDARTRAEEGRSDSKHAADLSRHLTCTVMCMMHMHARAMRRNSHAIENSHGCQKPKSLCTCTRGFAGRGDPPRPQRATYTHPHGAPAYALSCPSANSITRDCRFLSPSVLGGFSRAGPPQSPQPAFLFVPCPIHSRNMAGMGRPLLMNWRLELFIYTPGPLGPLRAQ